VIFDGVRGLCLVVGKGGGWMRRVDVSVCGGLMRRVGRGGALFRGWVIWLGGWGGEGTRGGEVGDKQWRSQTSTLLSSIE